MKTALSLGIPVLFSLLGAAVTAAQGAERWRMSAEQLGSNYITRIAEDFARQVRRQSQGELDIQVSANSVLYTRAQVKAAVARGDIQVGDLFLSVLADEDPLYALDSLPFLVRDHDQAKTLWAATRPAIEQRLLKDGVRLLYAVPWPPQSLFSTQPVEAMADFQGMRLRIYNPTTVRMAELLGAVPTLLPTEAVPQAFASGTVQGMLTSPATGMDLQAWKFSSHFYGINAFIPKNIVVVNETAFQGLSSRSRDALLAAARHAEMQGWELAWALTDYQVRTLGRRGMAVQRELSPTLREGLDEVGAVLVREWLEEANGEARAAFDAYRRASTEDAPR